MEITGCIINELKKKKLHHILSLEFAVSNVCTCIYGSLEDSKTGHAMEKCCSIWRVMYIYNDSCLYISYHIDQRNLFLALN